jgi:broad specificity phosphatase PhoE
MKKFTTIYIVRHGETHGNVREIITGHYNSRLTEKGKEQARIVGEKLKNIKFAKIFSSDLIRAKHTAKIIAEINNLKHEIDPLLKEKYFGIFEGKSIKFTQSFLKNKYEELNKLSPEEGKKFKHHESIESDEEIISRFLNFLSKISKEYSGKNIIAVSHMSFIRALLVHFGFANYQTIRSYELSNASYLAIETDGVNFEVKETFGINRIEK